MRRLWWTIPVALLAGLSACQSDQATSQPAGTTVAVRGCAYWNQEEYDRAIHLIEQERQLDLRVSTRSGAQPLAGAPLAIYTQHSYAVGGGISSTLQLDGQGRLEQRLSYDHSLVEVELAGARLNGWDTLAASWYAPGQRPAGLTFDLDVAPFAITPQGSAAPGRIQYALSYPAGWPPPKIQLSFGTLVGTTVEGAADPIAQIEWLEPGRGLLVVDMAAFFAEWNDNYTTPFKAGDEYPLAISLAFAAPADAIGSAPGASADPPFVLKTYDCKVDHSGGNPYLQIPPTTPHSQVVLRGAYKVPVTAPMLER